jgi:hypothetical protein
MLFPSFFLLLNQDFFNILNGHVGIYFSEDDLNLLLNSFDPKNEKIISIYEFSAVLLLGSDLLSPTPFILTGAEIASILLTNALQCNVLPSTGISRTASRVGQNFGANFAPTGRARTASLC